MPKTHWVRITDTAQIIPRNVPIPQANLDDHLRSTASEILHLLKSKPSVLPAYTPPTTQQALIDIAKLLNRDTTTPLEKITDDATVKHSRVTPKLPTPPRSITVSTPPSSKGALNPVTSEGGPTETIPSLDSIPVSKTNLTEPSITTIPTYPSLYPPTKPTVYQQPTSPSKAIKKRKLAPKQSEDLPKLLQEYRLTDKKQLRQSTRHQQ